jgi:hypothetical protein
MVAPLDVQEQCPEVLPVSRVPLTASTLLNGGYPGLQCKIAAIC